jgi:hypothetical protein
LRIITLAIVLLNAVPASAQLANIPLEVREMASYVGSTTHLDEFVEDGERPDDESVDWFLGDSGFGKRELVDGWHSFHADYGHRGRAGVQVKLTDGGTKLVVRLVPTGTFGKSPRSTGLDPWLNPPAPQPSGVFSGRTSFGGLTLSTKGLTDAMLHRAIHTLIDAEQGR